MKVSSKLIAGIVLCAGFVQVISPKASVTLVKEDPSMVLQYAITTQKEDKDGKLDGKESRRSYKTFKGPQTIIKFDEYRNAKLYVKKSGESNDQATSLSLRNRTKGFDPDDRIYISRAGLPYYMGKEVVGEGFQGTMYRSNL